MGHTHQAEVSGAAFFFFFLNGKEKSKNQTLKIKSVVFRMEISGMPVEGSVGAFLETQGR